MKIVYYTDQLYLHGGIERVLANKVNYWVNEKKIETHIITSEQKGNPPCYNIDDKVIFHDLGINYNRKLSYYHPQNFIKVPKHFFTLKKKIKEINPDIIVICNFAFDFYFIPYILPRITKIKEFHSSRYFENISRNNCKSLLKKLNFRLNDYIESKYHYLALLTEDEKPYYYSNNTVVIPNPLSTYPEKTTELNAQKVISAGRIAPVKGFENLILAWEIVAEKFPDWTLEIYGNGEKEYINELQNQINYKQLQNQIILCGSTNNIEEKMMNASIYAMSSHTECFPMVLLESLACGLPAVSFDCPNGPRNIITDNIDGLLVERGNIKKFAEALIKLIEDETLRKKMSKKGRENIKRLMPDNVMNIWLNLFKSNLSS
ncbi:glycosyltransferase family 4 protein [Mariniflexile soesokkakense]|uniref:Glycosyltransferase family 4 protein n=1 Tax=Mariniflexile soesokkakense TaxID=1343160 RepID=A0ABV0AD27_9FLAO